MTVPNAMTLDQQRAQFARSPFLAMPIAGAIMWALIGIAGAELPLGLALWALFIGTGMIFPVGLLVAKFTGEDLLAKTRPGNLFDRLFFLNIVMAWFVFAIAVPFAIADPTSAPLSVGILSGLMWIPFSAMIEHWVGLFHGITRTVLVLVAWYEFPTHRYVVIPAVIIAIYLVTIYLLATRPRS